MLRRFVLAVILCAAGLAAGCDGDKGSKGEPAGAAEPPPKRGVPGQKK